ncbi:MAG: hypothetical protein P8173_12635 [Gammaproteobacteria bacterium]
MRNDQRRRTEKLSSGSSPFCSRHLLFRRHNCIFRYSLHRSSFQLIGKIISLGHPLQSAFRRFSPLDSPVQEHDFPFENLYRILFAFDSKF